MEESRRIQGVPESQGVRIFGEEDGTGGLQVRLTFTEDPLEGDDVIEEQGVEFYVAPEVKEPLEDSIIDVAEEDTGRLAIRPEDT